MTKMTCVGHRLYLHVRSLLLSMVIIITVTLVPCWPDSRENCARLSFHETSIFRFISKSEFRFVLSAQKNTWDVKCLNCKISLHDIKLGLWLRPWPIFFVRPFHRKIMFETHFSFHLRNLPYLGGAESMQIAVLYIIVKYILIAFSNRWSVKLFGFEICLRRSNYET